MRKNLHFTLSFSILIFTFSILLMPDFLNVNQVLSNLDVNDGMVVAEFGCGNAIFAMALAKKLPKGRVYALDIQEEKLSALKSRASHEKVKNITTVHCDLERPQGSTLQNNSLDVVLITNMLFQVENKYIILEEGSRIAKQGGQILVVDWLKEGPFSPKEGMAKPAEIKSMAQKAGLSFKKEFATGDYHYGLLFIK